MLLLSRQAKAGYEHQCEEALLQLAHAAEADTGCLGVKLIHPGEEEGVEDTLFHLLIAFENEIKLTTWKNSSQRQAYLEALKPLTEGHASERGISGLAHWFSPISSQSTSPPPRWKVAIVTWLGIFPTVYTLFLLLGDLLAPWTLLTRIFFLTLLVVAIMTWVVAPRLTKLLRFWLYPKS